MSESSTILKTSLNSTLNLLRTAQKRKLSTAMEVTEITVITETVTSSTVAVEEKPKRIWPNIFVAFRVQNPIIVSRIEEVQKKLVEFDKRFLTKLTPLTALHITLMVGKLEEEEISKAIKAMKNAAKEYRKITNELISEFHGISSFGSRVLFGDCKKESVGPLRILQKSVVDAFILNELTVIKDHSEFNPHLTIARCQQPKRDKELAKGLIAQKDAEYELGNEKINEILLCRMNLDKKNDEFYKIIHSEQLFID